MFVLVLVLDALALLRKSSQIGARSPRLTDHLSTRSRNAVGKIAQSLEIEPAGGLL